MPGKFVVKMRFCDNRLAHVWQWHYAMCYQITIAELQRAVAFRPSEAVAIVQKLINDHSPAPPQPPFGSPSTENVFIDEFGKVTCQACDVKPAVSEIGILLDTMLPAGTRMPGPLRYAIARALLNVDSPPFDSIEDLSAALSRFERSAREVVIRDLVARGRAVLSGAAVGAVIPFRSQTPHVRARIERRRPMSAAVAADLRRELRRVDLERYARTASATLPDFRGAMHQHRRPLGTVCAGLVAGVVLIASGEFMDVGPAEPTMAAPSVASPAPRLPEPAQSVVPPVVPIVLDNRPDSGIPTRPAAYSVKSQAVRVPVDHRSRKGQALAPDRSERRNSGWLSRFRWMKNIITIRRDL
jgi:hypothetical protein